MSNETKKEELSDCCGAKAFYYNYLPDFPNCKRCGNPFVSSPHFPTGEELDKMIDDFTMENGVYKFRSKPEIKEFVSQLLLSKEKQWKDEMAGKIESLNSICGKCDKTAHYNNGECICSYEESKYIKKSDVLSLLSNNQEDK